MKELIKITTNEEGKKLVSARELYDGLGLQRTNRKNWCAKNIENNDFFKENVDWIGCMVNIQGNDCKDFAITLEFAKHLAMMSRTEKSHEYRNYFIECEKIAQELSQPKLPTTYKEALIELLGAIEKNEQLEAHNESLTKKIGEDKPLVDFANAISSTADSIDIGTFAKLVKDQKVFSGGRNKLFNHLRDKGYLMKNNIPYQKYIDQNIFEIVEYKYNTPYGEKLTSKKLLTGKVQVYITEK